MAKKLLIILFLQVNYIQLSYSQINWNEIVPVAYQELDTEVADTIAAIRNRCEAYRAEINRLIQLLNFDPIYICGKNDKYCREGMHKNFYSPPAVLDKKRVERNDDVYKLESNHVALYYADVKLYKWTHYKNVLAKHKGRKVNLHWLQLYKQMDADEKFKPGKVEDGIQWVKNSLVCELALNDKDQYPARGTAEFKHFEPKLKGSTYNLDEFKDVEWELPLPKEALIHSFPYPGQFAFDLSEPRENTGYLIFPNEAMHKIIQASEGYDTPLKARWIGNNGEVYYTDVKLDIYNGIIFFKIPKNLKPEFIYNFQLIILPDNYSTNDVSAADCYEIFRGQTNPKEPTLKEIEGERLVVSYYFRVAKYGLDQKNQTMAGTLDFESGNLIFETDEPLDQAEINGRGFSEAIVSISPQFKSSHQIDKVISTNEIYYYFKVPAIEPTKGVPLDQLLHAELDHTFENGVLQQPVYAAADNYEPIQKEMSQDNLVAKGYIAPKYNRNRNPDSLTCDIEIPYINEDFFNQKQALKFPLSRCSLKVGELVELKRNIDILQEQLNRRIDERSNFILELEKRKAAREGTVFNKSLEAIKNQEIENLSKNLKFLKSLDLKEHLKDDLHFSYSRFYPGTTSFSCQLSIKDINVQ